MTKFWVSEVGMVTVDYIVEAETEDEAKKFVEDSDQSDLKKFEEDREYSEWEVLDNVKEVES